MALTKDFSLVAVSSAINLCIGLLTTPVITRMALPSDYGNWSLFSVYTNVIYLFCTLGFDQVLVRYFYTSDDKKYKIKLVSICWLYPVLCATFIIIPVVLVLDEFFLDWTVTIYILLWLNILMSILNRITSIVLRFTDNIVYLSIFTILHKAVYVALAVLLLINSSNGFLSLTFSTIISTAVVVGGSLIVSKKYWANPLLFYKEMDIREFVKYGFPLMMASSVYIVFQTIDKMVIKQFCTSEELGIYASAASLIALLAIVHSSFNTVWWPAVMKKYEEDSCDTSFYVRANNMISVVMLMLGVLMIAFKDIIVLFLGPRYRDASIFIPFLMFQPIMYTISETTVLGLTFLKKSKIQLYISLGSFLVNLVLCISLTRVWGTKGTSIAVGTSYIIFFILRSIFSNYYYKIPIPYFKLSVSILLLYAFAVYETMLPTSWFSYVFASFLFVAYTMLYRSSILEMLSYIGNKLKKK